MATGAKTTERPGGGTTPQARRVLAWGCLGAGLALWSVWLVWRVGHISGHPIVVIALLIELSGLTGGVLVAIGLLRSRVPRSVLVRSRRDPNRYAYAVADRIGRTRSDDLQHDLRGAVDRLIARQVVGSEERAMIGVLIDAPRRVALVAVLSLSLLFGVAPMSLPPDWALAAVGTATLLIAASHVLASGGRIAFGDRTRWSYAALGELFSRTDNAAVAPRRWIGTIGTVVILNLAIALRGMSDRWTHGLPAMTDDQRIVAMTWASLLVLGGLFTLRTIDAPDVGNAHLVSRRLEERTARRSALGAAVCVGLVGLLAGILPASVDATSDEPARPETVAELERGTGANNG